MTYDPHYEVREIQRGIRHVADLYGLGYHPAIDGIPGPETGRNLAGTLYYMGLPAPRIRLGYDARRHLIAGWDSHLWLDRLSGFLFHPSNFYKNHTWAYHEHRTRLEHLRALRLQVPPFIFPVDRRLVSEGRTDRGQDMETQVGSGILALCDGVVTAAGSNAAISSLGQIVMRMNTDWRGWVHSYCFHLGNASVSEGQWVRRGQVIARSSARPPGAEDMPGHIEYGFATDSYGSIEDATDATHYTKSGQDIHDLLHVLNPAQIRQPAIIG